jgi:hypothetical protein
MRHMAPLTRASVKIRVIYNNGMLKRFRNALFLHAGPHPWPELFSIS